MEWILAAFSALVGIRWIWLERKAYLASLQNSYGAKKLLDPKELEALRRFEQAMPELRFHAKVDFCALLGGGWSLRGQPPVSLVAQSRADGSILALIDWEQVGDKKRFVARGRTLEQSGLKVLSVSPSALPNAAALRGEILPMKGLREIKRDVSQDLASRPAA